MPAETASTRRLPVTGLARAWNAALALLILAALVVQVVIAVRAPGRPPAHAVGTLAGGPTATRIIRVASFFTIQSNVLCLLSSGHLAAGGRLAGRVWRVVRLDALVGITVTGIVYATVLARVHEPTGWEQVSTNAVFHYAVPIATVAGWLAFGPRPRVDRLVVLASLVWPVLWFGYTLAHGAATSWYPYPFADVASHGYATVVLNALAVTAVLGAVAALFAFGDRRLPARDG